MGNKITQNSNFYLLLKRKYLSNFFPEYSSLFLFFFNIKQATDKRYILFTALRLGYEKNKGDFYCQALLSYVNFVNLKLEFGKRHTHKH